MAATAPPPSKNGQAKQKQQQQPRKKQPQFGDDDANSFNSEPTVIPDPPPGQGWVGKDLLGNYDAPSASGGFSWGMVAINPNRPIFRLIYVPLMRKDPRLRLGIAFIKGAIIQNVTFKVTSNDAEVADWVTQELDAFRLNGASTALDSLWFGRSACHLDYELDEQGRWCYCGLKKIGIYDAFPVHMNGKQIGMNVYRVKGKGNKPTYVPFPKALWCVHDRAEDYWFGQPAVYGAFEPWWETWCRRGYRDQRCIWFFKNAFRGPVVFYPVGATPVDKTHDGEPIMVPNKRIADEIVDKLISGAGASCPASNDTSGQWDIKPGESVPIPDGLLKYGADLANEKLEGVGVPPEVLAAADGTGAYAGRAVPMQGFNSSNHDTACELFNDYNTQSLKPRVEMWKPGVRYQVLIQGLYESNPYANEMDDSEGMGEDEEFLEEGEEGDEASGGSGNKSFPTDRSGKPAKGKKQKKPKAA